MFLSHLTTAALLLLAAHTSSAPSQQLTDEHFKLIILHNNDMHARFEQTNAASARCTDEDNANDRCYGGFARVAHVVRDYRRRADAGEIPRVLYLNAGDTYDFFCYAVL
jgi:2',3'-cyclic-nucleotide 2'-phosphodiesterase (5'-nucleotidase family)